MAVYTKLSHQQIESLLNQYEIGALEKFEPIAAGIENTNYFIFCSGKKYVLTVFERRVNHAELPFFVDLTTHLTEHKISCPKFVRDKSDNALNKIVDKDCAIIEFLSGSPIESASLEHCAELGKLNAQLHLGVQSFKTTRKNDYALAKWVQIFESVAEHADELEVDLKQLIADELYYLAQNWPFILPSGIVHTDLFPDNIFFKDGKVSGVIDFYFAATDFFAYDLAITINAWSLHNKPEHIKAFLQAYNQLRPLTPAELQHFGTLLRAASMRFLVTRLFDWFNTPKDALVNRKDPLEYLNKLKFWQNNAFTIDL